MSLYLHDSLRLAERGAGAISTDGSEYYKDMFGENAPIPSEAALVVYSLSQLLEASFDAGFADPTQMTAQLQVESSESGGSKISLELSKLMLRFGGGLEQAAAALFHLAGSQIDRAAHETMRQFFGESKIPDAVPVAVGLALKELNAQYDQRSAAYDARGVMDMLRAQISMVQFFLAAQIESMRERQKQLVVVEEQTKTAASSARTGMERVVQEGNQIISGEQAALEKRIASAQARFYQVSQRIREVTGTLENMVFSAANRLVGNLELNPSRAIPLKASA